VRYYLDLIKNYLEQMSANLKRRRSTSSHPQLVYVVLQRSSAYGGHRDEHDVSCVSVHTTLAAANQAAKLFFDIDDDEEIADKEDSWQSWEDLVGLRMQIDTEGKVRLIRTIDTREEDLVWVEEKFIKEDGESDESGESGDSSDSEEGGQGHRKRFKARPSV
jgi:hypothetical protein